MYRTGDEGDYGRPSTTWGIGSYRGDSATTEGNNDYGLNEDGSLNPALVQMLSTDEIITVPETPAFVYTAGVKEKDLYRAVGRTVAGYDWFAYSDGTELEEVDAPRSNSSDNYGLTADAVETEVYINTNDETVTVVYIHNYLAEVIRASEDEDGKYIAVKIPYRSVEDNIFYTTADYARATMWSSLWTRTMTTIPSWLPWTSPRPWTAWWRPWTVPLRLRIPAMP